MKKTVTCLIVALLSFVIGICASTAWDERHEFSYACAQFLSNYQD